MSEQVGHPQVRELVEWALPVQQRHFERTKEAALALAGQEDANEPAR